jgi:CRP-like cAMP-binding protein
MIPVSELANLAFFESLSTASLQILADAAQIQEFAAEDFIARQHYRANSADFLQSGRAQVLLRFEGADDLVIETLTEPGAMIGWSAFRPPYRYTASIRCESPCTLVRVPRTAFDLAFEQDPKLEYTILQRTARVLANRLAQTQSLLLPKKDELLPPTVNIGSLS